MIIYAYKTALVNIGDNIFTLLDDSLPTLQNRSIVAITSKIISLCEKSVIPKNTDQPKLEIIQQNADAYLNTHQDANIVLTIKNNILIPSAGIDESNGDNVYILYPEDIQQSAFEIWQYLKEKHQLTDLGVIITDSHTTPLRRGVTGIAIGWCGFKALYNYIGTPDLFGHLLRVTKTNQLDGLASSAVLAMGEGAEQTPLAVITDAPRIEFQSRAPSKEELKEITISLEEDLYSPLLNNVNWIWNEEKK
jgi:putative folate metabolism gamma-glutamate ligase